MKTHLALAALALISACKGPNVQEVQKTGGGAGEGATAEGDLRVLQSEKVSTAKQIADGVTAITPIGLVAGTASGQGEGQTDTASGDYNKMIDQNIAQIK